MVMLDQWEMVILQAPYEELSRTVRDIQYI